MNRHLSKGRSSLHSCQSGYGYSSKKNVDRGDRESGATLFGHCYLLPQKGIYIIENLNLQQLSIDKQYTFAFIGIPLKFTGATGSPLRPLALVS